VWHCSESKRPHICIQRFHLSASLLAAIALMAMIGVALSQCGTRKAAPLSADDQRVHDVLSLSWRVVFYAQTMGHLPSSLSEVKEDAWKVPVDPATSSPYFYEVLGRDSFRLCAVFSSTSKRDEIHGEDFLPPNCHALGAVCYEDPVVHTYGSWQHSIGRQCLDRRVPFMGVAPPSR
jgi:hypothetical protein